MAALSNGVNSGGSFRCDEEVLAGRTVLILVAVIKLLFSLLLLLLLCDVTVSVLLLPSLPVEGGAPSA